MTWQQLVMLILSFILMYLAIVKQFEPLLLLPISFGIFMSNLPHSSTLEYFYQLDHWYDASILSVMYMGVKSSSFPCMMFLAIGTMADFDPLIVNPISLLPSAAVQLGIYCVFTFASATGLFTPQQTAAIGIIGDANNPTAIYVTSNLIPGLVVLVTVAAYSYMALISLIQPPIMNLLTTDRERRVGMKQLGKASKVEKIISPVLVACLVSLLLPDVAPLLYMLILSNLFRECDMVERLSNVVQNAFCNICIVFPSLSVGATARDELFPRPQTLAIVVMGPATFSFSTFGDVVFDKVLYAVTGDKINSPAGSAGVSAVPMATCVSQTVGSEMGRINFLLMHAMGPNVTGIIGSTVAAGFFLTFFAH